MKNKLTVAMEAAKVGAAKAIQYFDKNPKVIMKQDNTPVTVADRETEAVIKEVISKAIPDSKFVGEEGGGEVSEEYWVIDPIDGTKFFIRGLPFWSILIAYVKQNEAIIGISYMPVFDEILVAERGKGAFLNGKKVQVSKVSKLEEAFLNADRISDLDVKINVQKIANCVFNAHAIGNPYGYHNLTKGKIDISLDSKVKIWDIAPFAVIVEEAGGKFTDWQGNPWQPSHTESVATNGLLHKEVISILNQ